MARRRFARWLEHAKITTALAAQRLGCSRTTVSLILNGHTRPGLELAAAIERETGAWDYGPIYCREWVRPDEAPEPASEAA